jgi:hypothetical protein
MKRLQCLRCGIAAAASWSWVWHSKELVVGGVRQTGWLCPECAGELGNERARTAFLKKSLSGADRS